MEFSPPKHPPKSRRSKWFDVKLPDSPVCEEEEKPVLVLKPFSSVPRITFDKVLVGTSKCCDLYIHNPLDVSQVVKVEKIPLDKGFFIKEKQFSLEPEEEKVIKIFWAPEKASSYRETIVFKSSNGCKTHVCVLGVACSPQIKKSQKTQKPTKRNNVPTTSSADKKIFSSNKSKYCEGKENLDFANLKNEPPVNITEQSNFGFLHPFEPRASFCLREDDEFPDSPIRRQTYTINTLFSNVRKSEILPLPPKESLTNNKAETLWEKHQSHFTLDNRKLSIQSSTEPIFPPPFYSKFYNQETPKESFLSSEPKEDFLPHLNDSLSEAETVDFTNLSDKTSDGIVETFDIQSKRQFFGCTPPHGFEKHKSAKSFGFHDEKEAEYSIGGNKKPCAFSKPFMSYNHQTFSDMSNFDITSFQESKIEEFSFDHSNMLTDNPESLCFSEDSFKILSDINESKEINFTYESDKKNFEIPTKCLGMYPPKKECDVTRTRGVSHEKDSMEAHVFLSEGGYCEDIDMKEKIKKETKTSVFLEIPVENSSVSSNSSSVTSSKAKRHSKLTEPSKHIPKKNLKYSPFKAKAVKSKTVMNDMDHLPKRSDDTGKSSMHVARKLCLKKSTRLSTSVVYHRNPFASRNVYYDEHWMEKQESAFTTWLNFILTPNDDLSGEEVKVDSAKLWIESIKESSSVPAPTKEELSLKAYTAARNLNNLRKSALSLYQSDEMVNVIKKTEKEVDSKKISIRKDRAIHADLGIKKDILEMLLSYNPLWLRIGLETVYGEVITLQSNSDVLGLSRFIVHRFLQNPDIAAKYSHPGVINYYKKGYEDVIARFILKRFLLLVYFLDTAKNCHLIKHNPCLFNKKAKFKASRDLLLVFSKEYLSGEGDFTKHLRYLGYKVSYQQTALEEFDFSVRNISTDLRCGLRLGRVVEILLQDWSICQKLRINTLNRLTKIHNNDVILKALKNASIEIENNIEAKNITDGDREKTLDLLWQIIFKTQISKLIKKDLLKKENMFLSKSLKLKADFAAYNILRKPECSSEKQENSILDSKLYKENEILQLLFQWCLNVCALYGVRVYNFTSSFSDGRALCFLLHHYLPSILPYESIKTETSIRHYEKQMQMVEDNECCPFFGKNESSNALMEKLLKNERENLMLVFQKFQEVGNIPILSHPSDISNTLPDEKVMITLVSYVNMRLMELSIEIRAARVILHAWRRYKLRKQYQKLEGEIKAVTLIQKAFKKYLINKRWKAENNAALKIQTIWRSYSAKKKLKSLKEKKSKEYLSRKAIVIQSAVRGFLVRRHILKSHEAATIIQTYVRRWIARTYFLRLKIAAIKIQQKYRAKVKGRSQRLLYVTTCQNVVKLQAYARGLLARNHFRKLQCSILKIQAWIRMCLLKKKYNKMRNACIVIQHRFRGYLLTQFYSQEYQNYRSSAIAIQKWYRTAKLQQHKLKCIIKIQANIRRYIAQKKFSKHRQSVIKIQSWWRAVSAQLFFKKACKSIICIQSFIRQCIASKRYKRLKKAAICLQKNVRAFLVRKRFQKMKASSLCIQTAWRSKCLTQKTRSEYLSLRKKVILIQSLFRCVMAMRSFNRKRNAAIVIQKNIRALLSRQKYHHLKCSIILIQRKWRATLLAHKTRTSYLRYQKSVIFIQSVIRRQIAYNYFKKMKQSAVIIQKYARMFIVRNQFLKLRKSSVVIQNCWHNILYGRKLRQNFLKCQKAVIVIQSWSRMYACKRKYLLLKKAVSTVECYRKGKVQRKNYLKIKQSTLKLQSVIRGYLCRKQFLRAVKSIIFVQACAKRLICRKRFLKTKLSSIKLQRFYRAYKSMCTDRQNFLKMKAGICRLQAVYRGWCVRKNIKLLHEKATLIQKTFRKWKAQSDYKKLRHSCLAVQRKFRAKLQMQQQYQQFIQIKNSIVKIQAFVRRCIARKQYNSLRISVIKLQSYVRMTRCYRRFHTMKKAAMTIQQYYRSYIQMKITRSAFLQKKSLVILLQAKIRMVIAQKKFLQLKKACIIIQSYFRMHSCQKRYIRKQNAALVIQRFYRNWKLTKHHQNIYIQERKLIIFLQSKFRSVIARKNFMRQKNACILIQSFIRMHTCRKRYLKMQKSASVIQKFYRSYKLTKHQQNIYIQERKMVIFLQSKVRSVKARKNFIRQRNACVYIQSSFRKYLARKKYTKIREATVFLQRCYRNRCLTKNIQQHYIYMKKCTFTIQAFVRGFLVRKRLRELHRAATKIQATYRSFVAQQNFSNKRKACICIQSYLRMYLERKKYNNVCRAAIFLQKYYRNKCHTRKIHQQYIHLKKCVILIQASVRGFLVRKNLRKSHKSATKIQAAYRSYVQQKNFVKQRNSCIYIQSCFRMYSERKKYLKVRKATIFLQKYYRSKCLTRKFQQQYIHIRKCIVTIQSFVRGFLARKNLKKLHSSATKIQAAYKSYSLRKKFLNQRESAIVIQRHFKSLILTRKIQNNYKNLKSSTITIQSAFRGYRERQMFLMKKTAATLIQAYIRMFIARKNFLKIKQSVRIIENYYIAYKVTLREYELYHLKRSSCIKIQAAWKRYVTRRKLKSCSAAAVKIQHAFRLWRLKKICSNMRSLLQHKETLSNAFFQHMWYLNIRNSTIQFQRAARAYLLRRHKAAVVIQSYFKMILAKRVKAAIKIQTYWRAYIVRRSITNKKILLARKRIQSADSSESKKLKNRVAYSIKLLSNEMSITKMLQILQDLDVCTNLSPKCCERFASTDSISIIIQLVQICNRSIPHMEIIKLSTNILLNLAKYQKTTDYVWKELDSLKPILQLMRAYREKGGTIFTKCCSLLWIFCQDPVKAQIMKNNGKFVEEMRSFHYLLSRKQSLEEKRLKNAQLKKASKSYFFSGSSKETSSSSSQKDSLLINPDWMLGSQRRREFKDSLFAVTSIMEFLNIEMKEIH